MFMYEDLQTLSLVSRPLASVLHSLQIADPQSVTQQL